MQRHTTAYWRLRWRATWATLPWNWVDLRVVGRFLAVHLQAGGDGVWQVLEADGGAAAQQRRFGDDLHELADVERPVVEHQGLEGLGLEGRAVGGAVAR